MNSGSKPSGQHVIYNGTRIQLQQGYGLSPARRPGWVPVTFRGRRMYATKNDFITSPGIALAKAAAGRI